MRSGFTLVETALTLVVAGLLLGIALPRFGALKQGVTVERAALHIAAAHRRARNTASIAAGTPKGKGTGKCTGLQPRGPGIGRLYC